LYTPKDVLHLPFCKAKTPGDTKGREGKGRDGKGREKRVTRVQQGRRSINHKTLFFVHPRGMFYTCAF
jgi:hypothetical protein